MSTDPNKQHDKAVQKLITLTNQFKDEGIDTRVISAALITTAGIYGTFAEAGNQGFLQPSGVDVLTDRFRKQLEFIQERKKDELRATGHDTDRVAQSTPTS